MGYEVGIGGFALCVSAIDEYGETACCFARLYVAPAISDHVARSKVQSQLGSGIDKHSRPGFAAVALVAVIVGTDTNLIQVQFPGDPVVDGSHVAGHRSPPCEVRLVCHAHQHEGFVPEQSTAGPCLVENDEVVQPGRRVGLAVPDDRSIEHAVTIKKDCPQELSLP